MHNISLIGDFSLDYMNENVDITVTFVSNPFPAGGEYYPGHLQCGFNGTLRIYSQKTWGEICNNKPVSPFCLINAQDPADPPQKYLNRWIIGMYFPWLDMFDNSDIEINCAITIAGKDNMTNTVYNQTITSFTYFDYLYTQAGYGLFPLWVQSDKVSRYGIWYDEPIQLAISIQCNAPVLEMQSRYVSVNGKNIGSNDLSLNDLLFLNYNTDYNCYVKNRWNFRQYDNGDLYKQENQYIDYSWSETYPPRSYLIRYTDKQNYTYKLYVDSKVIDFEQNASSGILATNFLYGDRSLDYTDHVTGHEYRNIISPILWETNVPIFSSETQGQNYIAALDDGDTANALLILKNALNYDDLKTPTINDLMGVTLNPNIPLTTTNNVYLLNEDTFGYFLDSLYSQSFWEIIKNGLYGRDVYENIINVRSFPVSLSQLTTTTTNAINFCSYTMDLTGVKAVLDYVFIVDCGTVFIPRKFNNFYDFDPYTDITLYLPFYGAIQLDCADYMNSEVGVKYSVDVTTGFVVISVFKNGTIMQSFTSNISYNISFSASNYTEYMHNIINTAESTVGNIANAVDGSINYTGLMTNATDIIFPTNRLKAITYGVPSAVSNTTLPQFPYVLIRYRDYTKLDNEQKVYGYPSNAIGRIGDFSGFLKCGYVDIAGLPLPAKNAIYSQLKNGIYI